jgi:outer membrane receptor protein involved in Fe transport
MALVLSGIVRAGGAPVADVRITVHVAPQIVVSTDSQGAFRVPNVILPVDVTVEAPGFTTRRITIAASPVEITLAPASVSASVLVYGEADRRDPATGAQTFSSSFLAASPAVTLDEALRVVPGLSLFRRSSSRTSNPTTHGVTMRGLSASGASRGVVLLDGLPLNDGFGAWVTWTRVPAGALDGIDVIPGAAGDMFGSDALGGVIRLRSAQPRGWSPAATVGAGTSDTWAGDGSSGLTLGRVRLWIAASGVDTGGEIPLEESSRGDVDRPASASWWNAFGRADISEGSRRWSVSALGGRDRRGNGTVQQVNRNRGATVSAAVQSVGANTTWAARVATSPNHLYQTFTAVAAGRASEFLTSTQWIDVTTSRALVEFGRSVPKGFLMIRGTASRATADFTEQRPAGTTTVPLRDDGESVSAQVGVTPSAALTFGLGGRHEWRAAPNGGDARDRATVGRATAAWRVRSSVVARASVATSHRWPTLNELVRGFRVGNSSTLPNPNLKPERARALDAGVVVTRARVTLGAAVFRTTVLDAIANVTLPSLTGIVRERRNAGEAHARGIEVDADVQPFTWLQMRGSLSATDATFRESAEPALEGNRLPQVPRISGVVSVDLLPASWWRAGVVVRSVGAQFDDDRNVFELAAATQADMRVSARLKRLEWALVVENVFDARVEVGRTPLVTVAPGRALRVSATFR